MHLCMYVYPLNFVHDSNLYNNFFTDVKCETMGCNIMANKTEYSLFILMEKPNKHFTCVNI